MNKSKYENIVSILNKNWPMTKFYYKDYLIERGQEADIYYIDYCILHYHMFIKSLVMIDVLVSDSFTKTCFMKKEVPFIHSEIFRDGF